MMIIGCDYHPSWQQICWVDTLTGETEEKKLEHASGEAERFYRGLPGPAVIGMESTGNCQWFVEMAKVAAARKLAIRLYWMLRTNRGYPEVVRVESSSRVALVSAS
jgi:hypothetical protein